MRVNMSNVKWQSDDYEKNLKGEKMKKKIKKTWKKTKLISKVFYYSGKHAVVQPDSLALSGVIGLIQGLKYGGNLKRGVLSALATTGVIWIITGIENIADNIKRIDELSSREE